MLTHKWDYSNLLDAIVSSKRIKDYLDSAEKDFRPTPSKRIAINNATIAWAADTDDQKDRFCLRDVSLDFPINELRCVLALLKSMGSAQL